MNFKDGDHKKYDEVRNKIKEGKPLTSKDYEIIIEALDNTSADAYWSTGGRNTR